MLPTVLLAALLATGPVPHAAGTAVAPDDPALARAQRVAAALTSELFGRLQRELATGGPAKAIAVCSRDAPAIAANLSRDGLTVRRVGTRVRNPANAPDAFEAAVLARWQETIARGGAPQEEAVWVTAGATRTLRLMRPIMTGSLCLPCHGDPARFVRDVRAELAKRYPYDRATGYREGELRGAVSVTVAP
jgi:Protein of unknown function (DUF3365)